MQNREHHIVVAKQGTRRGHRPAAVGVDRHLQRAPHSLQAEGARITRGAQQGLFGLRPPAALLVDADQHGFEAVAVERDEDVAGRQQRNFVLCRSATKENDDAGLVHGLTLLPVGAGIQFVTNLRQNALTLRWLRFPRRGCARGQRAPGAVRVLNDSGFRTRSVPCSRGVPRRHPLPSAPRK